VTHYFGRRSEIGDLAEHCRARDIKLIEDCALSLFSAGVGTLGDAAIFSLRKTLPVANGGILNIATQNPDLLPTLPAPPAWTTTRGAVSNLARWAGRTSIAHTSSDDSGEMPDMPAAYYYQPDAPIAGASRLARGIINRANKTAIVQQRRANYEALWRELKGVNPIAPLWTDPTLQPDECPLGLPILVNKKALCVARLNEAGIAVSPWWSGFHRDLPWNDFQEAVCLKKRLILLPVHQALTPANMEFIAATVRRIAKDL
jgi:dTDP-4-amino-4,6-dideoxygalactose transaminase